MNLSGKNFLSTSSADNLFKPIARDEFKQRSYKNSQILNHFKAKDTTFRNSKFTSQQNKPENMNNYDADNRLNAIPLSTKSYDSNIIIKNTDTKAPKTRNFVGPHVSFSDKMKQSSQNVSINEDNNSSLLDEKLFADNKNDNMKKPINIAVSDEPNVNAEDKSIIAKLEKKNMILMSDLRENNQLLHSIQKKLDDSTKDIVNKSNEIVSLKKQIVEIQDRRMNSDSDPIIVSFKNQIRELNEINDDLNNQINNQAKTMEENHSKMSQQLDEFEKKLNILQSENDKLKKDLVQKDDKLTLQINENEILKNSNSELTNSCQKLKTEINKLIKDNKECQIEHEKLQNDYSQIKSENEKLAKENSDYRVLYENKLKIFEEKINASMDQVQQKSMEIEQNKKEIEEKNTEIEKLTDELKRITQENDKLKIEKEQYMNDV